MTAIDCFMRGLPFIYSDEEYYPLPSGEIYWVDSTMQGRIYAPGLNFLGMEVEDHALPEDLIGYYTTERVVQWEPTGCKVELPLQTLTSCTCPTLLSGHHDGCPYPSNKT